LFDFIHGGAVTKIEIVEALAEKTGMQKKDAESVLETLVNTIQESLKTGQKVNLAGLGTFVVVEKKAKKAPKFKPGKQLKELLAGLPPSGAD
jgi:DNA-binding protein HU-beta